MLYNFLKVLNCLMEIYIEYVILDNLIINSIILVLTLKTLKHKLNKLNIFFSSSLGTVFAIFMPFITLDNIYLFLIKILVGLIMVLIIKKHTYFKKFIVTFFLFLTYTFSLGGLCFGLMYMFNFNTSVNGIIINNFEIPVSLFMLLISVYLYILFKSIKIIQKDRLKQSYIFSVVITQSNKSYNLEGFLDSGNQLYYHGQPIIILSNKIFTRIFKDIPYDKVLLNRLTPEDLKGANYITVKSVNNSKKILVFEIDELKIFSNNKLKKFSNTMVGLSLTNFNNEYDCLLHPDYF